MTTNAGLVKGTPDADFDAGASFVFWWLMAMALAVLAACVILPEWRTLQAFHRAEQFERHRLEVLQDELKAQQRLLEAMRSDPAAIARLAQRDLGYHRPGERIIPVAVSNTGEEPESVFIPVPLKPPAGLARFLAVVPPCNYDAVFCGARTRPVVLAMSLALIGVALVLFRHRTA